MLLHNKNKNFIELENGEVLIIDKISMPFYYVQGIKLTQYDVVNLMLEIKRDNIDFNALNSIGIKDESGQRIIFGPTGKLINTPDGWNKLSNMFLELI